MRTLVIAYLVEWSKLNTFSINFQFKYSYLIIIELTSVRKYIVVSSQIVKNKLQVYYISNPFNPHNLNKYLSALCYIRVSKKIKKNT